MRRGLLRLLFGASCHAPPGAVRPERSNDRIDPPPAGALPFNASEAGRIVLLSVDLPEAGTVIGGHYEGVQFDRQRSSLQMADGPRDQWMEAARLAGDSALSAAGFRVELLTAPTGDPQALQGVRFGLAGRVTQMDLRTTGYVEPFVIDCSVRVEWDLLDFATGAAIYEGRSTARIRGADSLASGVARATALALSHLVGESAFQRAVMSPRPLLIEDLLVAEFARRMPEPYDTIFLDTAQQFLSPSGGTMAGVAQLNGSRGYRGTALVLTRDGLALAPASVGRQRWLWALHADGRRRAVRVLRVASDAALVELSCPDGCATVPWVVDSTLEDGARVVWYGGGALAISMLAPGLGYGERTLRVQQTRSGTAWTLRGRRKLTNGEAIARTPDGMMVGVATPTGVLPLQDVFTRLRVQVR